MTIHYDEKGKIYTDIISKRSIPATIQTVNNRLHGYIYVREGERLKDELSRAEQFLAVTDVEIYDLDGKVLYNCEFVAINRDHIVWVFPDEENREKSNS